MGVFIWVLIGADALLVASSYKLSSLAVELDNSSSEYPCHQLLNRQPSSNLFETDIILGQLAPARTSALYLSLSKMDISLRQTRGVCHNTRLGVR